MPNMPNMMDDMAKNFVEPMPNISEYNSVVNSNTDNFERGMFDPFQNLLNLKLK